MTNNPYGGSGPYSGQPPMGGGPGGPQGPQYGGPSGSQPNDDGQSPLARVFSSNSGLPQPVRQLHLAALASAVGFIVTQVLYMITSSVVLSGLSTVGTQTGIFAGGFIFGMIFTVGLYVLVLIPLLGRKNWGRILGIVFAILGGLSGLFGLIGVISNFTVSAGLGLVTLLQAVVQVGTAVWFLVFAFRSEVAAWYVPYPSVGYQQNWGTDGQPGSYGYGGQTPPPGAGQYPGPGGFGQNPQGPANPYGGPGGPTGPNQGPTDQGPQQGPPQGPPSGSAN